ncbi:MAG: VirB4 family type IV secretion/conjugal transfer ATPase [Alphaproteobacteria bacterium]|nr:VirB4 family type IV secretion/conjugal transfer ATPase [Alphaproteobacteria bacterium]
MSQTKPRPDRARRARLARRERLAGDILPYVRHIDDETILLRDGQQMQVLHLAGFAFETADTQELNYRKNVRDTLLRGVASTRLSLGSYVIRHLVRPDMPSALGNPFARALDDAWRDKLSSRRLYVNDLFITLTRKPSIGRSRLPSFGAGKSASAVHRTHDRRELDAARDSLLAALAPYGARPLGLYQTADGTFSEPMEFLAFLFDGELRPVPHARGDLRRAIIDRRVSFGRDALEFSGNERSPRTLGAMLSFKEYPPHSSAGQLDALFRVASEMVVSQTFSFVDRQSSLNRMNLALRRMRAADDEALSLRRDLVQAKDDVAAGRAVFGEHHVTVMVRAEEFDALDSAVADVQAAMTEIGVIAVREDVAIEPSFWAQFPGNSSYIPRKALISSANFAGLASFHNHPMGRPDGNHWGPAVTVLETTAASPYYFNFHKGDLGNFLVIGPSGSGKTVVLNFLIAQSERFQPRVIFFDKDRGAEIFLRAMGGRYDLIRPGVRTNFNPLQLPDTPTNRRFLQQWTAKLVTSNGEILTADDSAVISAAVSANYDQDASFRRLRFFRELFLGGRRPTPGDLASRLNPWMGEGDRAWLFDNEADRLDLEERIVGFDMTHLLDDPVLRTPCMMYLFHRVEERLNGQPAIIVVDEGWKALDDDVFVGRIRDWEKTIRKRNGIVGFATQSTGDALESRIASAVIEQSAAQIFLPNARANEQEYRKGFGLSGHEFDLIRTLPDTSRTFLVKHGTDSVVVRLNLNGHRDLLTVLSGRERTVRMLDDIRAEVGDDPAAWMPRLVAGAR